MKRRDVVLGPLALSVLPHLAGAQPARMVRSIGFLSLDTLSSEQGQVVRQGFPMALTKLGYREGENLVIEWRWADGKIADLSGLAEDLVRTKVEVLVARTNAPISAARKATQTIPIVMLNGNFPVEMKFVESLARPGGNVTGITEMMPELTPERIRLLKEIVPTLTRLAIMWRPGTLSEQAFEQMITQSQAVVGPMGMKIQIVAAAKAEDFDAAFLAMDKEHAEALIVLVNPMFFGQRKVIVERAAKQRLPAIYEWKQFVQAGGLISYGADVPDVYRRAAGVVDKILKGSKPADIAVERPTLVNMGVNLKAAAALGVTIPDRIRKQAVEIIE